VYNGPQKVTQPPPVPRQRPHAETVYAALKRDILNGVLPPGSPLREEELGRLHRVSRTPVREALSRLETEGLAARQPRSGLVVSAPTLDEIIELYVFREALEGLAARLAAERRTELDLARLELALKASKREIRAQNKVREIDRGEEFHFLIWHVAGNRPLERALNDVHDVVRRFQPNTLAYPGRSDRSLREHLELLEAIRNRDSVAAERIAIDHVRQVRNIRIAISMEPDHSEKEV
jgi:DNA-binding GntR family transcriptional regulator